MYPLQEGAGHADVVAFDLPITVGPIFPPIVIFSFLCQMFFFFDIYARGSNVVSFGLSKHHVGRSLPPARFFFFNSLNSFRVPLLILDAD